MTDPEQNVRITRTVDPAGECRPCLDGSGRDADAPQAPRGETSARSSSRKIGRWLITGKISRGGFAQVYTCRDDGVVGLMKMPLAEKMASPGTHLAFEKEGAILAKLSHSNIPHVLERGEHEGVPFIVMEYIEGRSISQLIRFLEQNRRFLSIGILARVFCDILYALQHAHDRVLDGVPQRILHRDIKSANALIAITGNAYLIDFGIAGAVSINSSMMTLKGTLPYMAPEHLLVGRASRASDIFGMGAILWELLESRRFRRDIPDQDLQRLVSEGVAPPLARQGIPDEVASLCVSMLALDPEERTQIAVAIDVLEKHAAPRSQVAMLMRTYSDGESIRTGHSKAHYTSPHALEAVFEIAQIRRRREHNVGLPAGEADAPNFLHRPRHEDFSDEPDEPSPATPERPAIILPRSQQADAEERPPPPPPPQPAPVVHPTSKLASFLSEKHTDPVQTVPLDPFAGTTCIEVSTAQPPVKASAIPAPLHGSRSPTGVMRQRREVTGLRHAARIFLPEPGWARTAAVVAYIGLAVGFVVVGGAAVIPRDRGEASPETTRVVAAHPEQRPQQESAEPPRQTEPQQESAESPEESPQTRRTPTLPKPASDDPSLESTEAEPAEPEAEPAAPEAEPTRTDVKPKPKPKSKSKPKPKPKPKESKEPKEPEETKEIRSKFALVFVQLAGAHPIELRIGTKVRLIRGDTSLVALRPGLNKFAVRAPGTKTWFSTSSQVKPRGHYRMRLYPTSLQFYESRRKQ